MKNEWKPEELRATSEEIRGAVMPKTITPEMVGGTLLGVVNALGEVVEVLGEIPREHVKVKVRGYDGTGGVSGAGATVWLDVFAVGGFPSVNVPRRELTANEDGVVEFDIPHGYKYAVFAQIVGLSASFQFVYEGATEERNLDLWCFPVGVWALGYCDIAFYGNDETPNEYYREVPIVAHSFADLNGDNVTENYGWDANEDAGEEYEGCSSYDAILVATADTSFVIGQNSKSSESLRWCAPRYYGQAFPALPKINNVGTDEPWEDLQNRARADMDGNLNTAKIIAFCNDAPAAQFCGEVLAEDYLTQSWLPSGGQASLMQLNRDAINALMKEANGANGTDFVLLPTLKPGSTSSWTHYEYWWTSSQYDVYCSWVVYYNGYINNYTRYYTDDVRAVSAFHFEY